MAGRPQGTQARTVFVGVRLAPSGAEVLDTMRGTRSRSAFIRYLIANEHERRKKAQR